MIKEKYEPTELEVVAFSTADVIMTSNPDEYEGWNPKNPGGSGGEGYEGLNPH